MSGAPCFKGRRYPLLTYLIYREVFSALLWASLLSLRLTVILRRGHLAQTQRAPENSLFGQSSLTKCKPKVC